ncbi:MAG: peptidase, partial [Gammaproteobacteria bacterium]|nr:peptidase [Gammaproteobacteria bacterium]
SHILVSCDPTDETARQTAQARAVDLTGRIAGDPRAFARVAKDESDCASKAQGGALGQIGPGDTVPEFESVLRGLSDGEITAEPIL